MPNVRLSADFGILLPFAVKPEISNLTFYLFQILNGHYKKFDSISVIVSGQRPFTRVISFFFRVILMILFF